MLYRLLFFLIFSPLLASGQILKLQEWITVSGSNVLINGELAEQGTPVFIYDNDNVLCGYGVFSSPGQFGPIRVYKDDPSSDEDEGANPGEPLTITVNQMPVTLLSSPLIWTTHKDELQVSFYSGVYPTTEWISLYGTGTWVNGAFVQPGDEIYAFDADGTICGYYEVTEANEYGLMSVYRDDPVTEADEGAEPGDVITVKINGINGRPSDGVTTITWTQNGDVFEYNFKSGVVPTTEWISIWSTLSLVDGLPLEVGDVIEVLDPEGNLAGYGEVSLEGKYGLLSVYRDDPSTTDFDEGAEPGDPLTIRINGKVARVKSGTIPTWTFNGDVQNLDLIAGVIPTPNWQNFYGSVHLPSGEKVTSGGELRVYDSNLNLCGLGELREDGTFGIIAVYHDDPYSTDFDEGGNAGDFYFFKLDGRYLLHAYGPNQYSEITEPSEVLLIDDNEEFPFKANNFSMYYDGMGDRVRVLDDSPANQNANPDAYKLNSGELSIETWVFPMKLPAPGKSMTLIQRAAKLNWEDPFETYRLYIQNNDEPTFAVRLTDGVFEGQEISVQAQNPIQTGTWYHIAATYDGSEVRLYVNGQLAGLAEGTVSLGDGSIGFYTGRTIQDDFYGILDDIRLWDVARTETEIKLFHSFGLNGDEPNLVGYWPFESQYDLEGNQITPDLTENHNDLFLQGHARIESVQPLNQVQIAPVKIIASDNASGGDLYAVTGANWRSEFYTDGWPIPTLEFITYPETMSEEGDTLYWTPMLNEWGTFEVVITAGNEVGSVSDTQYVFAEQTIRRENEFALDLTQRGKLGAFGNFERGVFFNGVNGVFTGDFSLVDRNDEKFAGGLYSTQNSFRPLSGFQELNLPLVGFSGYTASMDDGWEPDPIGVEVNIEHYLRQGDHFQILEYKVKNISGNTVDELFAQFGVDFDILAGDVKESVGFDAERQLTYVYNPDAGNAYFGVMVLNHPLAGHNIFPNGEDENFIRSTTNLDAFSNIPDSSFDYRSMLNIGPLSLEIDGSESIAFAFVTGMTVEEMFSAADAAKHLFPENAFDNSVSAYFDGRSDRIRITDANPIGDGANPDAYKLNEGELTVEAWVFPIDEPGPNGGREIIKRIANNGFGQDPFTTWGLAVLGEDQFSDKPVLSFIISDGVSPISQGNEIALRDTARVKVGEWTHVAGTYDGTTARLYINGILANEAEISVNIGDGSTGLYIGGDAFSDRYFNGLIDEVKIWNTARPPVDIYVYQNVTLNGDETGLVGYWPFEEFVDYEGVLGTPDLTANSNDLMLQGNTRQVDYPALQADVQIAPSYITAVDNASGGDLYAVTGADWRAEFYSDGYPFPVLTFNSIPQTMSQNEDTLLWQPGTSEWGSFEIITTAENGVGTFKDTNYVFVEQSIRMENNIALDLTQRGKLGAFGNFERGVFFNGVNGVFTGDFSLVDRNDQKFAGGLYATQTSFRPLSGFQPVNIPVEGFSGYSFNMDDGWEPDPIGVEVHASHFLRSGDSFQILDFEVKNVSGNAIDDVFAQFSVDFDLISENRPESVGFDADRRLTYAYNPNVGQAYFGIMVLNHTLAGHNIFLNGEDEAYIRSTANLDAFSDIPDSAGDWRNMLNVGPFNLDNDHTETVTFAFVTGTTLEGLLATADQVNSLFPENAFDNSASAYFDGRSDRIRITDANPIGEGANPDAYKLNGGELTVEAWVFPMDEPGPNGGREIIKRIANNGFGQDPFTTWGLAVLGEDQFSDKPVLSFIISDGVSPISQGNEIALRDTARVKVGEWTHVAGTYDGSTARLYINGILANEANISINIGIGSTGLYIGGDAFSDRYFNGLIDEVRIWNTTRSQAEVFLSKEVTLNGDETGLAGYWPMEEFLTYGEVTGTPDLSANHNDLIVQGSTRLVDSAAKDDVFIAPAEIVLDKTYALSGFEFNANLITDGWPVPTLSAVSLPDGAVLNDRQVAWTPGFGQVGNQSLTFQASNGAGNLNSVINVFVESARQTVNNEVQVLITSRGSFGSQSYFPYGVNFNGRNGLYLGNFGWVSPTDSIFSGGFFKQEHFNVIEDFRSVTSNLPGFETAFQSSFSDALATKPSGLRITQTLHSKSSAPDNRYAIVEYRIDNPTGQTRDDLYVRLGMDFDVGDAINNLGGYDSLNQLSYVWEANGPNNPDYFGFALLDEPVSGHTGNSTAPGQSYNIPLSELTSLVQPVTIPGDVRATISSGPYTLQPGDSLYIAFAIIAGPSAEDLVTSVTQARSVYATIATGLKGEAELPMAFALEQNYPNPFNPTTSIKFSLPTVSDVTISIFDVLGRQVAVLVNKDFVAGSHNVVWNGKNQIGETMASGLYFYQIVATPQNGDNRFIKTKKMMLLK